MNTTAFLAQRHNKMNVILFRPDQYALLYNCTSYQIDDIPLEKRRRPILGGIALLLFILFEALYIPTMLAIKRHLKHSCYKVMFCIGIVDMLALCINAFLSGIFGLFGIVFCTWPSLHIVAGCLGVFAWCAETSLDILLATNRCFTLASSTLGDRLFSGNRTWFWVAAIIGYSLFYAWTVQPLTFSSLTFAWFWDPHVGYLEMPPELFENKLDAVMCMIVAISTPLIYSLFYIGFCCQKHGGNRIVTAANNQSDSKMAHKIFLQVFLLAVTNSVQATTYLLMEMFPSIVSSTTIVASTFFWINIHCIPPVIYLLVNTTIRNECRQLLGLDKFFSSNAVHSTTNGMRGGRHASNTNINNNVIGE